MKQLERIPRRDGLPVVLVVATKRGWLVGIGPVATGRIAGKPKTYRSQDEAEAAALDLADRRDLLVLRS